MSTFKRYDIEDLKGFFYEQKVDNSLFYKLLWDFYFEHNMLEEAYYIKLIMMKKNIPDSSILCLSFDQIVHCLKSQFYLEDESLKSNLLHLSENTFDRKEKKILNIINENFSVFQTNFKVKNKTALSDIIKNKEVVILGPTNVLIDDLKNMSSKIKVAFSYRKKDFKSDIQIDISYYSKQFYLNYYIEIFSMIREGIIKVAVVNGLNKKNIDQIPIDLIDKVFPPSPFLLSYDAPLLAAPRCVYDLRLNGAKNVFVYGVDLYTNFPFHRKEYNCPISEKKEFLKSWSVHDIFFNFLLIKKFYKLNFIRGDQMFEKAMKFSINEYINLIKSNVDLL